jgi:hypothetical protein
MVRAPSADLYVVGFWHAEFRDYQLLADLAERRTVYKQRVRVMYRGVQRRQIRRWPWGTARHVVIEQAVHIVRSMVLPLSAGLADRIEYVPVGGDTTMYLDKLRVRGLVHDDVSPEGDQE